jgi:hypothetical protein
VEIFFGCNSKKEKKEKNTTIRRLARNQCDQPVLERMTKFVGPLWLNGEVME